MCGFLNCTSGFGGWRFPTISTLNLVTSLLSIRKNNLNTIIEEKGIKTNSGFGQLLAYIYIEVAARLGLVNEDHFFFLNKLWAVFSSPEDGRNEQADTPNVSSVSHFFERSVLNQLRENYLLSSMLNSGCWKPGRLSCTLEMWKPMYFWVLPCALLRVGARNSVCLWESGLVLSSTWASGIKQLLSGSPTRVLPSLHFLEPAWQYWKLNPVNRKNVKSMAIKFNGFIAVLTQ